MFIVAVVVVVVNAVFVVTLFCCLTLFSSRFYVRFHISVPKMLGLPYRFSLFFVNDFQPSVKSFLCGVVCSFLLLIASRPIRTMGQLVRFLAPPDINSAVLRLLSAEMVGPGVDK